MGSDILSPGKGLVLCIQPSFKTVEEQLLENVVFQGFCCFQQNLGPPGCTVAGSFTEKRTFPLATCWLTWAHWGAYISLFPQR